MTAPGALSLASGNQQTSAANTDVRLRVLHVVPCPVSRDHLPHKVFIWLCFLQHACCHRQRHTVQRWEFAEEILQQNVACWNLALVWPGKFHKTLKPRQSSRIVMRRFPRISSRTRATVVNFACRSARQRIINWVSAFFKSFVPFENATVAQTLLIEGSSQHSKCLPTISSQFRIKLDANALMLLFRHPARHEK